MFLLKKCKQKLIFVILFQLPVGQYVVTQIGELRKISNENTLQKGKVDHLKLPEEPQAGNSRKVSTHSRVVQPDLTFSVKINIFNILRQS